MNVIMYLFIIVFGLLFWFLESEDLLKKLLYRALSMILFLVAGLETFAVTNGALPIFDNTGEASAISYLFFFFFAVSFLDLIVNAIQALNWRKLKENGARDESR